MDGRFFDELTKLLGETRSRRNALIAVSLSAAAATVAARTDTGLARRKRKKRKRPNQPDCRPQCAGKACGDPDGCGGVCSGCSGCRQPRETCSSAAGQTCCGNLVCSNTSCAGDATCVQGEDGPCTDRCDCRLGLECSDRAGNTCRTCTLLQNPCQSHDECCLASAACGSTIFATGVCCQQLGNACGLDSDRCANTGRCGLNGCGGVAPVCCRGQGFLCESNCECCDPLRCLGGTCQ